MNRSLNGSRGGLPVWLVVVFCLAVVTILVSGVWFYNSQRLTLERNATRDLAAIAELKIGQIAKWRSEHLTDAQVSTENPLFRDAVAKWLATSDKSTEKDIIGWFQSYSRHYGYEDVMLSETNGMVRLRLHGEPGVLAKEESEQLSRAFRERKPVLTDLHLDEIGVAVHLSVIAPILGDQKEFAQPVGAVAMRVNAAGFLFPLVQFWPAPSDTAESLLVRRDGDSVLFLNDLRHRGDTSMKFRLPLTRSDLPAVAAVLGRTGVTEGVDYRGATVFSALRAVPDSTWYMVSKMDKDEAMAVWRTRSLLILGLMLGLMLALAAIVAALWQRETKRHAVSLLDAEVERRRSEARYYTTLMSVGDGVIVTDVVGRIDLMNKVAEMMTGWSLEEAKGKALGDVFKIVHEETRQQVEDPVMCVLRENRIVGLANHTVLISRDGTERPIADSGAPIRNEEGALIGTVLVFSDQTRRRQAEMKLKGLAERMQTLLAAMPDIVMEVDVNKVYTWANPAGRDFFGDDCIGREASHYFEGQQETYRKVQPLFNGDPGMFHVESWQRRRDGQKRLLAWWCRMLRDADGRVKGALSTARDITEARRYEDMVIEEKERLLVTLHSIGDAVICTDTEGRITLLNPVAEQLTGWSQSEATGQPVEAVFRIFDELTREACESPVAKVLRSGEVVHLSNHTELVSRDGRSMTISDSGAPIKDASGKIIGVVLVFRDTTEKQKLLAGVQLASKLESVGLLAGGIAHDFNNLLGGIFGYVDVAQACLRDRELDEAADALTRALSVFDRARALTGQLLAFSKGGQPVRTRTELAPLIERNVRFALSGSNVGFRFEGLAGLWMCDCDQGQIGQVIDNIVINAQQAMPAGGVVSVYARNIARGDQRPEALKVDGDYVEIAISDTGIGIPANILPRIFEPFFSTKDKGHGLGLSTCYFIIQQHGGCIEVESKPGVGSKFRIYLPALKEGSRPSDSTGEETPAHKGEGRILVMDDEPYIRNVLGRMLKTMGYAATVVKDGTEVLREFEKSRRERRPFRAVILDLTVPGGMGGTEALAEIRKIDAEIPVVAASGYSDDPVMADPHGHGFSGRIAKPFRMQDIAEILRQMVAKNDERTA